MSVSARSHAEGPVALGADSLAWKHAGDRLQLLLAGTTVVHRLEATEIARRLLEVSLRRGPAIPARVRYMPPAHAALSSR